MDAAVVLQIKETIFVNQSENNITETFDATSFISDLFSFPFYQSVVNLFSIFVKKNRYRICLKGIYNSCSEFTFILSQIKLKLTGSPLSSDPRVLNSILPLTKAVNHLLESK